MPFNVNLFKKDFHKKDPDHDIHNQIGGTYENISLSEKSTKSSNESYLEMQLGIYKKILFFASFLFLISCFSFGFTTAFSLLLGAFSGLLYLRLLARSIGKLGISSNGITKFQLLVPVVIFLLGAKTPQIELLPTMLGFFIFKPCLIFHFLSKD